MGGPAHSQWGGGAAGMKSAMWLQQASLQAAQAGRQHMAAEDHSMELAFREGKAPMVGRSMEVASSMHNNSSNLQAGMEEEAAVVVVVVVVALVVDSSRPGPQQQVMASSWQQQQPAVPAFNQPFAAGWA